MEEIVTGLGSFGLVLAFLWLAFRKKRGGEGTANSPEDLEKAKIPLKASESGESTETGASQTAQTASKSAKTESGPSWWDALAKTRSRFSWGRSTEIQDLKDSLEEACIVSDLGVQNTQEVLDTVDWTHIASLPEEERVEASKQALAEKLSSWTHRGELPWPQKKNEDGPTVFWFVGVNGVGKTTSIAKFANELKNAGHSVMLAAGDTFRAAAGEQLETWAQRLDVPCVRGSEGADSSSVLFDAIQSAKAKKIDFVLCDSAGRLHNHGQLMEALKKNRRVMSKALETAPHETLLVLDGNTGQNMLSQANQFSEDIGLTGLVLTKVDGSAKGGAIVAVSRQTELPIRRLGLGEKETDFVAFEPEAFIEALLGLSEGLAPKVKVNSQEAVQSP